MRTIALVLLLAASGCRSSEIIYEQDASASYYDVITDAGVSDASAPPKVYVAAPPPHDEDDWKTWVFALMMASSQ